MLALPRKPNPTVAYKELKANATAFGVIVVATRLIPYVLHALQKSD